MIALHLCVYMCFCTCTVLSLSLCFSLQDVVEDDGTPLTQLHGHTSFPVMGLSVPPRQGCGTLWSNVHPNFPLRSLEEALHCGQTVTKGVKWGVNVWVKRRIGDPFG